MSQTSESLKDLADAIDLLADQIKTLDAQEAAQEFIDLRKEFDGIARNHNLIPKYDWSQKHQKGYLKNWLNERNLITAQSTENLSVDKYLVDAAEYLADNFSNLAEFYQRLKYGQSLRRNFNFEDKKNAKGYISKWCQMLKNHKIIDDAIEKQQEIYIDIAEMALATVFINGYWLELFLRSEIGDLIKSNFDKVESFDVLSGVQLLKPDNKYTEFDLMLMVNDEVYWFECKSGDIGSYYGIFNNHRQLIGLEYSNSIAIIPSPNAQIAGNFRERSQMQTFFATDLQSQLNRILFKL